ncbi:MAG: RHS repeat-associated core domain-containing protein [Anaerolineales bacterium]|jgi:RHS repeat-associated protein|nr:MAG: RHS repeat-associated core domain-containing protein [Anaerolineales bacterium]
MRVSKMIVFGSEPFGAHYEVTNGVVTKYYYAGAQRIAMRQDGDLFFIIGDHLGSASLVTNANGTKVSEIRYRAASLWDKAWGEVRYESGASPTEYTYTGQYSYTADFGLMFYREASRSDSEVDNARWYDPSLGRFAQADTIVPSGIQGWDRYAYVNNSPVIYTDPSGHFSEEKQLKKWYGLNWRDKFSPIMISFLLEGQMGDVIHGDGISIMFVEDEDGVLSIWNLDSKSLEEISNYNDIDPEKVALYRPSQAGDGPTPTSWVGGLGEGIGKPWYGNPVYEKIFDLGCNQCADVYNLPDRWYQGDNQTYVDVVGGPVGFQMSIGNTVGVGYSVYELARQIGSRSMGDPRLGIAILAISLIDAILWDTAYGIQGPGHIAPIPLVPRPPTPNP